MFQQIQATRHTTVVCTHHVYGQHVSEGSSHAKIRLATKHSGRYNPTMGWSTLAPFWLSRQSLSLNRTTSFSIWGTEDETPSTQHVVPARSPRQWHSCGTSTDHKPPIVTHLVRSVYNRAVYLCWQVHDQYSMCSARVARFTCKSGVGLES